MLANEIRAKQENLSYMQPTLCFFLIILLHTLVSKHVDNFDEHASGYSKFQIPGFYILIRLVLTFVDILDCVIETY